MNLQRLDSISSNKYIINVDQNPPSPTSSTNEIPKHSPNIPTHLAPGPIRKNLESAYPPFIKSDGTVRTLNVYQMAGFGGNYQQEYNPQDAGGRLYYPQQQQQQPLQGMPRMPRPPQGFAQDDGGRRPQTSHSRTLPRKASDQSLRSRQQNPHMQVHPPDYYDRSLQPRRPAPQSPALRSAPTPGSPQCRNPGQGRAPSRGYALPSMPEGYVVDAPPLQHYRDPQGQYRHTQHGSQHMTYSRSGSSTTTSSTTSLSSGESFASSAPDPDEDLSVKSQVSSDTGKAVSSDGGEQVKSRIRILSQLQMSLSPTSPTSTMTFENPSQLSSYDGSYSGSADKENAVRSRKPRAICEACSLPIHGKCIRAPPPTSALSALSSSDRTIRGKWHNECFKCTACDSRFESMECYALPDGLPYCASCYHARNGSLCCVCGEGVEGACVSIGLQTEDSDRLRIAHVSCFRCGECRVLLRDAYYELRPGEFMCDVHATQEYHKQEAQRLLAARDMAAGGGMI
ncbi:uncharacterized protein V1518DRAFT_425998 [Limtongia smithiae]|uniref:uncharacterized protein n=1 Tax=Limtongia smithiae TaxID=1125753 RepID=UPI0034CD2207